MRLDLKNYRKAIAAGIGIALLFIARYLEIHIPGLDQWLGQEIVTWLIGMGTGYAVYQVPNGVTPPDQEPMEYGGGE